VACSGLVDAITIYLLHTLFSILALSDHTNVPDEGINSSTPMYVQSRDTSSSLTQGVSGSQGKGGDTGTQKRCTTPITSGKDSLQRKV
jgi:hypothetical protein